MVKYICGIMLLCMLLVSADSKGKSDPLLGTDYVFDVYDRYIYAWGSARQAYLNNGTDDMGGGLSSAESTEFFKMLGSKQYKRFLLPNHTKVQVIDGAVDGYPNVASFKVLAGETIEDQNGNDIKAEGKTTLYCWSKSISRKGTYKTSAARKADEAKKLKAGAAELKRMEDEANRRAREAGL